MAMRLTGGHLEGRRGVIAARFAENYRLSIGM